MRNLGKSCRRRCHNTRLHIEQLESRLVPANFSWATDSSGFWDNPANWTYSGGPSTSGVPEAGDNVSIDRGAANPTITIQDVRSIGNLSLSERLVITGTVTCAGPWSLNDDNNTVRSTLEVATGGTLSLQGGGVGGNHTATFTNSGTIVVGTGTQTLNGQLLFNQSTGVISWEDNATLQGNSILVNLGTFLKPAGSGTSSLTKPWSNRGGTIRVDAGRLEMTSNINDLSGMAFAVAQNATAFVSGFSLANWSGTISGTGAGTVQFGDANRPANITLAVTDTNGTRPADATFNFPENMLLFGRGVLSSVFASGLGNGTLTNSGFIRFGGTNPNDTSLDTLSVINQGTIAFAQSSNFNFRNTGVTNTNQGIISLESDGTFGATVNANGVIANEGRIIKVSGAGVSTMNLAVQFKPGGVIEAQSGTLQINGVVGLGNLGGDVPTSLGGTFTASAGATILLTGSHKLQGTYTGSGAGTLQFGDSSNPANISLSYRDGNGNYQPTNTTFNFPQGFAHYRRGTVESVSSQGVPHGTLTNSGSITFDQTGDQQTRLFNLNLENSGNIILANAPGTGMLMQSSTINNTGTIDINQDSRLIVQFNSATINNAGLLLKSAGTGVTTLRGVIMLAGGTVEARAGTLELQGFGGAPTSTGGSFIAANGATILLTEQHYLKGTYTGSGLGTVQIGTTDSNYLSAVIRVDPTGASFNFGDGLLHFVKGSIYSDNTPGNGYATLTNNGSITIDTTNLASFSTLSAINNAGSIAVAPTGQLRLTSTTLNNFVGGLIDFQGDGGLTGSGRLENHGALRRSSGPGTAEISVGAHLWSEGSITISTGALRFSKDNDFQIDGADIRVDAGGELILDAPNSKIGGTFTASGSGLVTISRNMQVTSAGLVLDFADGVLRVAGGGFNVGSGSSAEILNRGFITVMPGTTNLNVREVVLDAVPVRNLGTIRINNAGLRLINRFNSSAPMLTNSGTIELLDDAEVVRESGKVLNQGRILKTGPGTSFFRTFLDNQGSVEVPEGTLGFSQYGFTQIKNYTTVSGGTLTGGTWKVSGTGSLDLGKIDNNSTDPISTISGATIVVDGANAYFDGLNSLKNNAGSITLSGGADLTLNNNDFTNAGLLRLGSGSVLTVKSFSQTATGGLGIGISGLPQDGKFGKVASQNMANLAGGLKIDIEGGYGITSGQTYSFLSASSFSGQFDSVAGLKFGRATLMSLNQTHATTRDIVTLLPAPDIAASAVTGPATALAGENATITWTVTNLSSTDAPGTWTDTVYLSSDDAFDLGDIAVGRVEHTGGLGAGKNYSGSLTAKLPAVSGSYRFLVVADGQARLSDINRGNNAGASTASSVSYKTMTLSSSESVALAPGTVAYRQVTLASGESARVEPNSGGTGSLLFAFSGSGAPDLATRLPATESLPVLVGPGTFVVAIIAAPNFSGSAGITIAQRQLAVSSIDNPRVGSGGTATLVIRGSAFQPGATVSLVDPNATLPAVQASSVRVVDESTIMATFNLASVAVGRRKVRVAVASSNATSDSTVEVTPAASASFSTRVITPESVRPMVPFDGKVLITNTGTSDAQVPLLYLSQSAPFKFVKAGDGWMNLADTLQLVAHPGDGRNFLRPGESVFVPFKAYANTTEPHIFDTITVAVIGADSQTAFDPATLDAAFASETGIRPAAISLLKTRAGNSLGSYTACLGDIASNAAALGLTTFRVDELLQVAIRDISAKDILASARGNLTGVSIGAARDIGLNLVNVDTGESYPAVIALNGTFAFHGVPRGYYRLKSQGFGIAPTRIVVGSTMATIGTVNAIPFQQLSGTVIDGSTGKAVANAQITAEEGGQVVSTKTDSRGRYSLMLEPSLTHNITISKEGLVEYSSQLTITAPTNQDFTLDKGRTLSGIVRNGANGVGGATITLTGNGLVLQTESLSDGSYSFSGLSGKSFEIQAESGILLSPFQSVKFTDAQYSSTANPLDLVATVNLTGTVTAMNSGTPLQATLVGFRDLAGRVRTAITNAQGQYSLRVMPNQAGSLFTESPGFLQFRAAINSGTNNLDTPIALQALGSVSGFVSNGDKPAAGTTIRITSTTEPDSFVLDVKTTSSGSYSIGGLPNGSYIVEWLGNTLSGARQSITISNNQAITADIRVSGCQIAGAVQEISNIPSAGYPFIVLSGGQVVYSGRTDPMGRYSIEVATAGAYRIVAQTATDSLASALVEVGASDRQLLDKNLSQGQPSRQLILTNGNSQPVSGATVEARIGGLTLSSKSDSSGRVSFSGIIPEMVQVVVLADSGAAIIPSVDLTVSSALSITVATGGSVLLVNSSPSFAWQVNDEFIAVRQGTRVAVSGIAKSDSLSTITIGNLPSGQYRIFVYRNENQLVGISSGTVDVASGQTSSGINLVPTDLVKRLIRVHDQNGNALNRAFVTAKTVDGTVIDSEVTDFSGLVSITCPPSSVACLVEINFNGIPWVATTSLETGTDGEVAITMPLVASSLIPQPSYAQSRGLFSSSAQNNLVLPGLPPPPSTDDPCYGTLFGLYISATKERDLFEIRRDIVNTQWEAFTQIEQATYGELTSKLAIAGLKLTTAFATLANIKYPGKEELLNNGLSDGTANSIAALGSLLGNSAELIGSGISDNYDPSLNGKMSTDTFQNLVGLLNARGASIFQIAGKGLAEVKLISESTGKAVPVLDSVREILQQTLELLNIKFQLDQITDNLGRFNNYNSALDDYINSYKRAREAIKIYSNALGAPSGTPCGPTPPTLPGPPPGKPFPGPETQTPHDPNDILGPVGIGAQKFVGPADVLSYTIRFENAPVAPATTVAPAAVVTLTQTLDPDLDPASVRFVGAGFADVNQSFADARFVHQRYDDRSVSGLFVDLDGYVDIPSRTIHWSFTSIDPNTGEAPADASLGFLAMNNAAHAGEGYITYSVKPIPSAPNNSSLSAQASIVFDTNAAIPTPAIFNTIDASAPVPGDLSIATISGQEGSKALVLLGARPITLNWTAGADTGGSGVANHTLQVSSDGGTTFTNLLANSTKTSATFTPDVGTRYQFRLLATDQVGNTTSGAGGKIADLYVIADSNARVRRNGDNLEALAGMNGNPLPFLTRPVSDTTPIAFLGTDAAANFLTIDRATGAIPTPLRFFGNETVSLPPTPGNPPPFIPPDTLLVNSVSTEDGSISFSGYQAGQAIVGGGTIGFFGVDSAMFSVLKSLAYRAAPGGDDYTSLFSDSQNGTINGSGGGTSVQFNGVPSLSVDIGVGDTAASSNGFSISAAITAPGLKLVTVIGGAGKDYFSILNGASTTLPVAGGGYSFDGGAGTDSVDAEGNTNWTLTNSLLTSAAGHRLALASVEDASLTGGASNNILDASLFTGTTALTGGLGNDILKGGKGRDTVREYGDRATNFTLTNSRLTGLGTDTLSGIENADLVGGAGNNIFDLSLFSGTATIDCYAGGTDTVKGSISTTTVSAADYGTASHNFTVTATRLTHPTGVVNFTSVEKFELFGSEVANTFDVSTYTGSTILHGEGGTDTVAATRDATFTLSDTLLSVSGGGTHTLDGIKAARLTGGIGANTFTIGAWTGQATINGSTGTDTLVASGDFNFTLGAASLAVSSGATVSFAGIEKARLTGGNSANTLDASLFTGSVMLFGLDGNDTLKGGKGASVLVGGNGSDNLSAGTGRSILIGGTGADTIAGGIADDLIIHGSTRYDANTTALDALLAEWSRTTATYALRVSHLRTGSGGLNGANKLTGAITDDIATDTMAGASGQDWFFARVTAPADILSDRASNENLN